MQRVIIFLSILLLACSIASATTNVYGCVTLNTAGSYIMTSNINSNGSTQCIVIDGVPSGTLTFDCDYHTLTNTMSSMPNPLMYPYVSMIRVLNSPHIVLDIKHCTFDYPNLVGTSAVHAVLLDPGAPALTYIESSSISNCAVWFNGDGTGVLDFDSNTVYNGAVQIYNAASNGAYVISNTFTGTLTSDPWGVPISIYGVDHPQVYYNHLTGASTVVNQGWDDAILLTNTSYAYVFSNTISTVWDACIEPTGTFTHADVSWNLCSDYGVAGFGSYYTSAFDYNTFYDNTLTPSIRSGTSWYIVPPSGTSSFTHNTFHDNFYDETYNNNSLAATFGNYYTSYSTNTFTNNKVGPSGHTSIYFGGSASDTTDGGGNYCYAAYPTGAVTCH